MTKDLLILSCHIIAIALFQGAVRGDDVQLSNLPTIAVDLELFANSISNATLSNKTELSDSIKHYLELHGPDYFGSTVTVLSGAPEQKALYSPYVYWNTNGTVLIQTDSLMDPSYGINEQSWLREPIDQRKAVWSEPYFDQGGGNVWMMTRSYPITSQGNGEIVAVATTDVHIDAPVGSGGSACTRLDAYIAAVVLLMMVLNATM